MCLNPIRVPNNSSVLSRYYLSKGFRTLPCGHCFECQQMKSLEWEYRAWWQFRDIKKHNGYALFDTLTYTDDCLPHISDFLDNTGVDFPCFSLPDVQSFMNRLQQAIRYRYGYKKTEALPMKYFLTSEYGTTENRTHRPHYHIIFYIYDSRISPLCLSHLINRSWPHGRTDGVDWKGKNYVLKKRVIDANSWNAEAVHLSQYVTKYIEKDCKFSKVINARLWAYMFSLYQKYCDSVGENYSIDFTSPLYDEDGLPITNRSSKKDNVEFWSWFQRKDVHSTFLKAKHLVEQFHKQSQQFGMLLLDEIDLPYLWNTGCQKYRKGDGNVIDVKLPLYYYRKLFQEQVYLGDKLVWTNTEIGKRYVAHQQRLLIHKYADDIKNAFLTEGCDCPCNPHELAEYVVKFKDTVGLVDKTFSLFDILDSSHLYLLKDVDCNKLTYYSEYFVDDGVDISDIPKYDSRDYLDVQVRTDKFAAWCSGFDEFYRQYTDIVYKNKQKLQERYEALQERKKNLKPSQLCLPF